MKSKFMWFLCGVATTVVAALAVYTLFAIVNSKRDFSLILDRMRAGALVAGDDFSSIATLAVNSTSHNWQLPGDDDYWALTYSYGSDLLIVFMEKESIFAALYVQSEYPGQMEWVVLDRAAMARYVDAVSAVK